jgi:hypothetical protein
LIEHAQFDTVAKGEAWCKTVGSKINNPIVEEMRALAAAHKIIGIQSLVFKRRLRSVSGRWTQLWTYGHRFSWNLVELLHMLMKFTGKNFERGGGSIGGKLHPQLTKNANILGSRWDI